MQSIVCKCGNPIKPLPTNLKGIERTVGLTCERCNTKIEIEKSLIKKIKENNKKH